MRKVTKQNFQATHPDSIIAFVLVIWQNIVPEFPTLLLLPCIFTLMEELKQGYGYMV